LRLEEAHEQITELAKTHPELACMAEFLTLSTRSIVR